MNSFLGNIGSFLQNRIAKPIGQDFSNLGSVVHSALNQAPSALSHIGGMFNSPQNRTSFPTIQDTFNQAHNSIAPLEMNAGRFLNNFKASSYLPSLALPKTNSPILNAGQFALGLTPQQQKMNKGITDFAVSSFTQPAGQLLQRASQKKLLTGSFGDKAGDVINAASILPVGKIAELTKLTPEVNGAIKLLRNKVTPEDVATLGKFGEMIDQNAKQDLGEIGRTVHSLATNVFGKDAANWSNQKIKNVFDLVLGKIGQGENSAGLGLSVKNIRKAAPTFDQASKDFGENLRTFFTGARDSSIAETNQLRDKISNIIKNPQDQEALTIYREFKNKPQELKQFLSGDHPFYSQIAKQFKKDNPGATVADIAKAKQAAIDKVKQLEPIIKKALNPTQAIKRADQLQSDFFSSRLAQGKKQGFLDSKINPNEYINRILMKEPVGNELPKPKTNLGGGKIGKNFNFGKQRSFPTILHAIAGGKNPATLNAVDAMSLYGDRFGVVSATKQLLQTLKDTGMGKFGTEGGANIPKDWVRVGPGNKLFENSFGMIDKATGKPVAGSNFLMAPPKVAEALNPLIEKNGLASVPWWQKTRIGQAYLKSVELGLSVFHMRALSLTGLNNMGYKAGAEGLGNTLKEGGPNMLKTLSTKIQGADFQNAEKEFIKNGGTTSIIGRTIEAYRGLKKSSLPEEKATGLARGFQVAGKAVDVARGLPGVKQVDSLAAKLSHNTFDVMQRYFKVADYSLQKANFLAKNPNATQGEVTGALRDIAKQVNATYGGLQWENLGINKTTQNILKTIFLAPDWTFSNVLNANYAVKGGAATNTARMFWARSAVTGIVASQLLSKMISGQFSPDPTQVYMGKDKNGKDIYSNVFFVGAAGDAVNTLKYGPVSEAAGKMAPFLTTGAQLAQNRNYFGQQIVPTGMNPIAAGARYAGAAAGNLTPLPFSISGPLQMAMDKNTPHTGSEYVLNALTGARTSHKVPNGMRQITTGPLKGKIVPQVPKTQNDFATQALTGKVNASVKPSLQSFQNPNLLQRIENFIMPKANATTQVSGGGNNGLQNNALDSQAASLIKQSLIQDPNTDMAALQKQIQDSYPGTDFLNAYLKASGVTKANATKIDFNDHSLKGATQRDAQFKAAIKIYGDSNIPQSFKDQAFKRMGISNDQISYMSQAAQPEASKLDYFTNEATTKDHNTLMQELASGRQKGLDGSQLVSSGVLTALYDGGYISKSEHTLLSKLSYTLDKNGNPVLSSSTNNYLSSGSGSSSKALTARKTLIDNVVKLTKSGIKAPKISSAKLPSGKSASLGTISTKAPVNPVKALTSADIAKLVKIAGKASAAKTPSTRGFGSQRSVRVPHIRITGPKKPSRG